jgi:hypothetical protein
VAKNVYVEIDIPEAATLAGYTGIESDLLTAREFARLLAEYEKKPPDWSLADPLTTATLVRYARPFASGVRIPLGDEALATLNPEQRAKHDWFKAVRDKHIAHSVNAFEENQPIARYWLERVDEEGITQIQCNQDRMIGLSEPHLHDLIDLTVVLLTFVQARLVEEKAKVLEIVRRMPIAEVLARGVKTPSRHLPDPAKRRP